MRSLTAKLTLAFLAVAITGALLVAVFVGVRAQREFDQFILNRFQADVVDELATYYQQNGSWEGLGTIAVRTRDHRPGAAAFAAPVALADADGTVVYGSRRFRVGQQLSAEELRHGARVDVDGETAGVVLFENPAPMPGTNAFPESPEASFIGRVNRAILFGALGATLIALLLGAMLARTITGPVRELTRATQAVAGGDLGYQVPVTTEDEIGELAASFNRMSADLADANQARRQMTADVAHDLRTPLSIILGYTEALAEGKLQGTPEMYEAMHGEARLLSHLIDDLRILSLADAGELPLNRQPCLPKALLERTANAHATQADQQGIDMRIEAETELPTVDVDPERMAQVMGNLVVNALRYTPSGGEIVLAAAAGDGGVILQVRDSGIGIKPEDLPRVFHRFYRADRARPQNGETGLGLAIAKGIVDAHGGRISVESVLGSGTTFSVWLPL